MEHLNKTQLDDPNVVGSGGKQTLKIADIFRTYLLLLGKLVFHIGQSNGYRRTKFKKVIYTKYSAPTYNF